MPKYKSLGNGIWIPENNAAKETDFTKNLQQDKLIGKDFKKAAKKKEKKDA